MNWIKTSKTKPPVNIVVNTKIDDSDGVRNEQKLMFSSNLWWPPKGDVYVYYTPTHWSF